MSGLTIKELITKWGFSVDSKALDALDKRLESLQSAVLKVGGLAVGAAASMFGLATSAADSGAAIGRTADRIGISAEALQEYQYAARVAGQSNEGFTGSLQGLVKNLYDARRGLGSSKEAFYLLGNAVGEDLLAKGMPVPELLGKIADGLNLIKDPSRRLELAGQLFGGDSAAMVTTLRGGSAGLAALRKEARATGVVMGDAGVKASLKYAASLERAKSVLIGLKNTVGVALFPVVEKAMGSFTHWIAVNRAWLASGLHEAFKTLTGLVEGTITVLYKATAVVRLVAAAFGGWQRVLKVVTGLLVTMLALRIASFAGAVTKALFGLVTAFKELSIAGALASVEFVAIGAAVLGLMLILEDIVAYFQGRKSITGLLIGNFQGLSNNIDKWLAPVLDKLSNFGKLVGRKIVDGLSALGDADWKKVGDFVMHALELILKVSTIPMQIGWAIAGGIMDGLVDGLKKKFPKVAEFLGLNEDAGGGLGGITGKVPAPMDASGTKLFGTSFSDVLKSAGQGVGLLPTPPAGPPASAKQTPGQLVLNVTNHQQINVPPGTPPEKITPLTTEALSVSLQGMLRETQRATAGAPKY